MKGLKEVWYNVDHLGEDLRVTCNKLGEKWIPLVPLPSSHDP